MTLNANCVQRTLTLYMLTDNKKVTAKKAKNKWLYIFPI